MTDPSIAELAEKVTTLTRHLEDLALAVDRADRHRLLADAETSRIKTAQNSLAQQQIDFAVKLATSKPGPKADEKPPVEWMTVDDPEVAAQELTVLLGWVNSVWTRYDKIAECWPWHPEVVAELLACRRVWIAATAAGAPATAAADWHTRFRIGAYKALLERFRNCDRTGGHKHAGHGYEVEHLRLVEYAHWWATSRDTGDRIPGLTRIAVEP